MLFAKRKDQDVQGFMLKLVNNHCADLEALVEGPRIESRVNLTVVVLVIPVEKRRPVIHKTFAAVTKCFSTTGVSLVLNEPRALDQVMLAFRWESETKFVRGEAKHLNPMGAGFYQLGLQLQEVVPTGDYPELATLHF